MKSVFSKFFKRSSAQQHLGRWNTIVNEKETRNVNNVIEKNIYWGNHDHCGSEVCKTPTDNKIYDNKTLKFYLDDPYWPFIL
jgi:hypothetical protein|tara:strand:+ start:274 stop:519 length:246 start_codon:yes stop_codon:yes gene_type:complete